MKKIALSEDQLNRLVLNEGYFDNIEKVYNLASSNVNVRLHPAANLSYEELCDQIYVAIKGLQTDEDSLLSVLQQVPDLPSLRKLIKTFASERPGETLLDWIDGDIDGDSSWAMFWPAFRQVSCPVTADTANINEGLSGLTEQSDTNWVTSFQQQLSDAGYGGDLGTSGPNGDGIDGRLGPKSATAAYKLLVAKGIIKSSSEVTPKEDGTEPKQDGTQPQQDVSTNPVQNSPGNGGLQGLSESINHFRRLIK